MPYVEGRVVHDADAHVMETPEWLRAFADPAIRDRVPPLYVATTKPGEERLIDALPRKHADPEYRARDADEIMLRKNWAATGSFLQGGPPARARSARLREPARLQHLPERLPLAAEHGDDVDFAYGFARAHNRAMLDFCAVDRRLLATCYVPLARLRARARDGARGDRGGRQGAARAVALPARPRAEPRRARSGLGAGAGGRPAGRVPRRRRRRSCSRPTTSRTGCPREPDFHGGEENFRSVDYMAIPYPPMQTVATLIFDGVLERFPRLMIGVIEQGASWVPGWMRTLDSAFEAFRAPRGAPAEALAEAERVRAPPGARDAVPDRGRRLDHREGGARDLPLLVRLPARRGRPQSAASASRRRTAGLSAAAKRALLPRELRNR